MEELDMPAGLLAEGRQGDNSPPMSVGDLASAVKRTVEDRFGRIRVRGEISGWKRHSSGHCYFTLKDDSACIDAVIWRSAAGTLAFRPEDGAEVIATAKMTTYPARSKYQLVVERMELAGEGALMALLERRKKALAAEGLFDPARKRPLPFMPRVIGVVTSPTGAVIRDILHRLEDRCPTRVILWPVPVQGEGAAAKIAAAIRGLASYEVRPDLIIVARGGGSIEDLWAFNEEEVVRAAAESPIPLISAVGHETDITLIDHAADLRAPTPTAAAELAVPVRAELLALLDELSARKRRCLTRRADLARERFALTTCRWPAADTLFGPKRQRLDEVGERLPRGLGARAHKAEALMNLTSSRLRPELLSQRLARAGDRLGAAAKMLPLVHPDRPLGRGFVRVTAAADGRTLTHAADARAAGRLLLRFGDGELPVSTDDGAPVPAPAKVERSPRRAYVPPHPNLFD
ncbi:exodeoxyribonuclease VII large subunit [Sphingomonas glaciei]|uniref:Exodeoxyribonuclease 7 large subunit n=1 Tax=Sphingomonas glaciei TaxID=2938948 RepID=A0ABY5MUI4_9SPHN|nr:exodeoxyribonuclease VII large subunit [Sphingomonas glaciei]UUR07451.1 exodeoxyribonuclease VII large subunit [Sphingomonas glaciei]